MESALSDGNLLELLRQIKMWSVFPHYGTSIYIHMCYLAEKLVSGHQKKKKKNGIKLR